MNVEVHLEWEGRTHLVGHLYTAGQGPAVTFDYAAPWLKRARAFSIDPTALPLRAGPHSGRALFGAILDCGPDRWGRVLIERAVHKKLLEKKPYHDLDYVLALDDVSRLGALRFRAGEGGPFLAATTGTRPPLVRLNALLRATEAIHGETENAEDLRFLLGAGSPMGGARPKAAVQLPDQNLALAKFPRPDDTRDIGAGEILALTLADKSGIRTAEHRLVSLESESVAVITRFDRADGRRIPFLSGASLLGLTQGEPGAYTALAEGIRQFGSAIPEDLRELWRRLIFSLLASNHDDHLRNHGFLMFEAGRWSLSPAYDLNPVPEIDRVRVGKTPITEAAEESSIALALDTAPRFGLKAADAKAILLEVFTAVGDWRKTGRALRLKASTLDAYASAFEHPLMDEARRLLGK